MIPTLRTDTAQNPTASFRLPFVALALLALIAAGCGDGGDSAASDGTSSEPEVVRSMDGDTAVVRTVSGSVWGREGVLEPQVAIGVLDGDPNYMFGSIVSVAVDGQGRIFVMDRQSLELRVFDSSGSWVDSWGRDGEGPGEFAQPDGGMTVLSDGRVVVRDPGNARFQVYSPEGQPVGQWTVIRGGFNTSNPFARQGDTILTPQVTNLGDASVFDWKKGYVRVSPEGVVLDTLDFPEVGYEGAQISASSGGGTSVNSVPWSPQEHQAWHPDGYFLHGISDAYSITLLRSPDPLRIERAAPPVQVQDGERTMRRAQTMQNMRGTDPNWRWNGPEIPNVKPAFSDLFTGLDGRIWVLRAGEAYPREDPDYDPTDPESVERAWGEDSTFDVFESDGTFLGTAAVPRDFSTYPTPVFDGDQVWATTRDDFGVQRVVRYRVAFPGGG